MGRAGSPVEVERQAARARAGSSYIVDLRSRVFVLGVSGNGLDRA